MLPERAWRMAPVGPGRCAAACVRTHVEVQDRPKEGNWIDRSNALYEPCAKSAQVPLCRVLLHLWTRASHGVGIQTAAVSLSEPGFAH
jgi:hypothetical protein